MINFLCSSISGVLLIAMMVQETTPLVAVPVTLHRSIPKGKGSVFIPNNRISYRLQMGLYDSPLPPPPPEDFADEYRKKSKQSKVNRFRGNDTNEDGENENSSLPTSSTVLFYFNDNGEEVSGILPSLGRNPALVPSFYEPTDNVVRSVLRMTQCNPQDACWALEACKGNIMDASVAIALAQRNALNAQVALPSDCKEVDWDEKMKELVANNNKNKHSPTKTRTKEDWQNFEQEGYSIGFDGGLRERTEALRQRERVNEIKRRLEPGKPDEEWLPGSPNPKPSDDEPWFTG